MDIVYPASAFHRHPTRCSATGIPLSCNICPKKPDFSDVSHLLTHIASKAHLSTYYRIKVRSVQEDSSRRLIDEYDAWYATNSIEDLMSERLNLKEQKRALKARQAATVSLHRTGSFTASHSSAPFNLSQVDPKLFEAAVKQELEIDDITPSVELESQYDSPSWLPWANTGSYRPFNYDHVYEETPTSFPESPSSRGALFADELPTTHVIQDDTRVSDAVSLKGVIWPGMDLFDSATPNMRRKRNQKKSLDVIDRLEATSNLIEATEIVYTPEIIESKSRPITGHPHSSCSPVKRPVLANATKKTRKSSAGRKPLEPKAANAVGPARRARTVPGRSTVAAAKTAKGKRDRGSKEKPSARKEDDNDENLSASASHPAINHMSVLNSPLHYFEAPNESPPYNFRPSSQQFDAPGMYPAAENYQPNSSFGHTVDYSAHNPFETPQQDPYNAQYTAGTAESTSLPVWDFLGQDLATMLVTPLYFASSHPGDADDDQRTISAPLSDT